MGKGRTVETRLQVLERAGELALRHYYRSISRVSLASTEKEVKLRGT